MYLLINKVIRSYILFTYKLICSTYVLSLKVFMFSNSIHVSYLFLIFYHSVYKNCLHSHHHPFATAFLCCFLLVLKTHCHFWKPLLLQMLLTFHSIYPKTFHRFGTCISTYLAATFKI